MAWFRSNWRWATPNLMAGSVIVMVSSQGSTDWSASDAFDPMLESGKWAIRLLLICLSMTPLHKYFGWSSVIPLRKPAGLCTFGFAVWHVVAYIREVQFTWLEFPIPSFVVLGMVALVILTVLAVTSNRWAMRRLRKNWKRLHRLVYLACNLVVFHAILASTMSKKMMVRDPQAIRELKVYLALFVVLLVVRIPLVRRSLVQIPLLVRRQREADGPLVISTAIPDSGPDYRPKANGHRADFSLSLFSRLERFGSPILGERPQQVEESAFGLPNLSGASNVGLDSLLAGIEPEEDVERQDRQTAPDSSPRLERPRSARG